MRRRLCVSCAVVLIASAGSCGTGRTTTAGAGAGSAGEANGAGDPSRAAGQGGAQGAGSAAGRSGAGPGGAGGNLGGAVDPRARVDGAPSGGGGGSSAVADAGARDGAPGASDGGPSAMPAMPPPSADEPLPPCRRTVNVANSGDLGSAITSAQPGDCIVMADGEYTVPTVRAKGTAANPVVIRAANALKAIVSTGALTLQGAAYVVVQGLMWQSSGGVRIVDCDHCRLSRSRIQIREPGGGDFDWIVVTGTSKSCRIDHNDLGPKRQLGNLVMLGGSGPQTVQNTRIDHNHFHDVVPSGGNGWETIRAGLSGWSFSSAYTIIEQNLFVHTGGDPEVISMKSSDNTIRYNTMRASAGQFVLRHGNRSSVYGNYILGDGVAGSYGIRVCGGDHKLYNNYVGDVAGTGIFLEGGESDDKTGALTDHKQVFRTQVLFNTIVGVRGAGIAVGGSHPMQPVDSTIAFNVVQGASRALTEAAGSQNTRYLGNIVFGGSAGAGRSADEVRLVDPKLVKVGDVFKLGAGSPAIDAADSSFPFVTDDIDGKPRLKPDVGADEWTMTPAKYGLLSEKDVGPLAP